MKRLILAVLPILLAAQIPLNVTKIVPSDWKRNFDFGVKWTGLLLDSYFSDFNNESESETVPDGIVTTTVVLASMSEFEDHVQIVVDQEVCRAQVEIAKETEKAMKVQREFNKKYRIIQIKSKTIEL
jgi:hypothetical protein